MLIFGMRSDENHPRPNNPGTPGRGGKQTLSAPFGLEPVREISAAAAQLVPTVRTVSNGRAHGRKNLYTRWNRISGPVALPDSNPIAGENSWTPQHYRNSALMSPNGTSKSNSKSRAAS